MKFYQIVPFLSLFITFYYIPVDAAEVDSVLKKAKTGNKYTFIIAHRGKTPARDSLEKQLGQFIKTRDNCVKYILDLSAEENFTFISQYRLFGAPDPLLLIISPEGAVTGGYQAGVTSETLEKSLGYSLLMRLVLAAMQANRIALVCLENSKFALKKTAKTAIKEFGETPGMKQRLDVLYADPDKKESKDFLSQVQKESSIKEALVIFMMPPGRIANILKGDFTADDLNATVKACTSGCCPSR